MCSIAASCVGTHEAKLIQLFLDVVLKSDLNRSRFKLFILREARDNAKIAD